MQPDHLLNRYLERLRSIPAPGGNGCHPTLLGVANAGVRAGIQPDQILSDLKQAIPIGKRKVADREIGAAVLKALIDYRAKTITMSDSTYLNRHIPQTTKPLIRDGSATLRRIINQGGISGEVDLWKLSPIRLWESPEEDLVLFLSTLFDPADLIFIGERHDPGVPGKNILPASTWIDYFRNGGKTLPFVLINLLSGKSEPTKTGNGETCRGDACVASYRYCLAEFDNLSREDQIRFWSTVKLPIRALVDSGGKSIHAWIDVPKLTEVKTAQQWGTEIKGRLYGRSLVPLGVDAACSNPARLSRLPGHFRKEKGKFQRLLWLSAEGRPVLC